MKEIPRERSIHAKMSSEWRADSVSSVVSIVRGEHPEEAVKEALDMLGGLKNVVSGKDALIKPNLGAWSTSRENIPEWLNRSCTTKPEIVVALIKELKAIGVDDVSVADGAPLDLDMMDQLKDSGMKEMVEPVGGRVIDLDREDHTRVKVDDNLSIEIANSVLNTSNLINVPVMKTHILTKVTLGIKNLKGVVSKASKRVLHRGDLERCLALLCKAVKPRLTIMDGLVGMEGLGPAVFGKPTKPGLVIAGIDPVAVDAVTAAIMGYDPKQIKHIRIASALGLGKIELERIEIRGLPLEEAKHPFEPAQLGYHNIINRLGIKGIRYFGWSPGVIGSECSGCAVILGGVLWAIRDDVPTGRKPLDIVTGPRDMPEGLGDNVLFYGACQAKNKNKGEWVPGCPPTQVDAYRSICRMTLPRITYTATLTKRLLKRKKVKPLPEWEQYQEITNP